MINAFMAFTELIFYDKERERKKLEFKFVSKC